MRWWAYVYVAFLGYIGVISTSSSLRLHGKIDNVLELLTSIIWPLLVLAYFAPPVAQRMRPALTPLYVVALCWTAYTVWRGFRPSVLWPQIQPPGRGVQYGVILFITAALVVPVVVLG